MSILNSDIQIQKKISILNKVFENHENFSSEHKKGELIFKCVNQNCKSHLKRRDKFCINIFKESAHCWVCGIKYKNISGLIRKIGSQTDASDWQEISDSKNDYYDNVSGEEEEKKIVYYNHFLTKMTSIFNLSTNHPARIYLREKRFLNLEKCMRFNIQFVDQLVIDDKRISNCICIPSHSLDGIDYLFFRSIKSSFKHNTSSPKANIIFNDIYINWNKPICLTEGVFDSIRIFPHMQSIPILGSFLDKNSALFQKILEKKPPKIFVCLDPDAIEKQIKILDLLYYWNVEAYSIVTVDSDLGESTDNEIIEAIKNAKKYSSNYKLETLLKSI